jgi:hypothetical protein
MNRRTLLKNIRCSRRGMIAPGRHDIAIRLLRENAAEPIEITVRLGKSGLYWYWLKALTRFPTVLMVLVPIGYLISLEARSGGTFYNTIWFSLFYFVAAPWAFILLAYRNTFLKNTVRYIFSNSGISTAVASASSFVEWSWAARAIENRHHILLFLKNGFVLLPKNQMNQDEIASVRTVIRGHLKHKAALSS